MEIITIQYPLTSVPAAPQNGHVAAIGEFDGVHLGHQKVVRQALDIANALALPASVVTFDPHPKYVLGLDEYGLQITPLEQKLAIFADLGISYAFVIRFDLPFSRISPARFVDEILVPMRLRTAVVGFDFTFGFKGEGNPELLARLAEKRFSVEIVPPFLLEGEKVSSTCIRGYLERGDVEQAARQLGRRYRLSGQVVHGMARGRKIGFPTANIDPDQPFIVPRNGVYAIRLHLDGKRYAGVMNIGIKPTFEGEAVRTLEAHLLDFSDDIYGKRVEIEFIRFLRSEQKFASIEELTAQIRRDADHARQIDMTLA
jgi:riboflavin kinase/FMN adenylyltransferase